MTLLILGGGIVLLSRGGSGPSVKSSKTIDQKILIRDNSHQTNPGAKVNLVEFGDYQCPACGAAYPIVKQVLKDYGEKVNYVFRNYPLSQHANSQISAEAAEAAGAQGKYWEMHDKLYSDQIGWDGSDKPLNKFIEYAKDLGLDVEKFKAEVTANKYASVIQADIADGNAVAIQATPTFFVNGQELNGIPSYNDFKELIDTVLAK